MQMQMRIHDHWACPYKKKREGEVISSFPRVQLYKKHTYIHTYIPTFPLMARGQWNPAAKCTRSSAPKRHSEHLSKREGKRKNEEVVGIG